MSVRKPPITLKNYLVDTSVAQLGGDDAKVRAQAAKLLGRNRYEPAIPRLINLLQDPAISKVLSGGKSLPGGSL